MKNNFFIKLFVLLTIWSAAFVLFSRLYTPQVRAADTVTATQGATLSIGNIQPANPQIVSRSFTVDILLDTAGQEVSGVDARLTFDPAILQVEQVIQGAVANFRSYPELSNDNAAGTITISANIGSGAAVQPASGSGLVVARVRLTPKVIASSTTLTFTFVAGERNDSNVVRHSLDSGEAVDILSAVYNQTLAVQRPISPACALKSTGDADCKNNIRLADFEIWRKEYFSSCKQTNLVACGPDDDQDGSFMDANFNYPESPHTTTDTEVSLADFEIWRQGFF